MTDSTTLLGVLIVFYFLEGVWWVPRHGVCLSRVWPGGRFRPRRPWMPREQAARGPLAPSRWIAAADRFLCTEWPLAVSPLGLSGRTGFVPVERTASLRRKDRRIVLDGRTVAETASPASAGRLQHALQGLAGMSPEQRSVAIEREIERTLDGREARRRLRRFRRIVHRLGALPPILAGALVVVAPLTTYLFGLARVWPALVAAHVALAVPAVVFYLHARRLLIPRPTDEALSSALMLAAFPPATARFAELLSRDLLSDLDPLAPALVLLERRELTRMARTRLAALEHGALAAHDDSPAVAVERWFRARQLAVLLRTLRDAGVDPGGLRQPPVPQPGAVSYCPVCRVQYRVERAECADCPGVTPLAIRGGD